MPEQLVQTVSHQHQSCTCTPKKVKFKLGEWPGESTEGSEPGMTKAISKISGKISLAHSISSPNTSFKTKCFSSSTTQTQNIYTPLRGRPRETIMDIRRRVTAREKGVVDDITLINAVKANYRFIYRINDGVGTVNTILQDVCEERGWREFQEMVPGVGNISPYERAMRSATGWNLWWSYSIFQFSPYKYLRPWQFTNHNPKGFQFCNKLYLTMYLRKMKATHGNIFDFYPLSFIVPEDYLRLSTEHCKRATESYALTTYNNLLNPEDISTSPPDSTSNNKPAVSVIISKRFKAPMWNHHHHKSNQPPPMPAPSEMRFCPVWISKPVAQSQGKGIFLTTDLSKITTEKKSVVQEYISRPMLIGGYKWDVRIYVCVAAIDPLVIYVYHEGLCRFCTEKYITTDLNQMYSHLTNASLNKLGPGYEQDKEMIGPGCKWPLRRLRQYFHDRGLSDWFMWQKIMTMVVLTVIGDSLRLGYSASNRNCFDLFGFDVLVDEDMKPWLLECNYSPGLGGDCETDQIVKRPMLHELFDLLGFPEKSSYKNIDFASVSKKYTGNQEEILSTNSGGGETIPYNKDQMTRHYFDLLMDKMKKVNAQINGDQSIYKKLNYKWNPEHIYSPEARLMDAKTIYSQNLVVQYLKNQSQGKISNKVREQLISLAAKKLKKKIAGQNKLVLAEQQKQQEKGKRKKPTSPARKRVDTSTQYEYEDLAECDDDDLVVCEKASASTSSTSTPRAHQRQKSANSKQRPKTAPSGTTTTTGTTTSSSAFILETEESNSDTQPDASSTSALLGTLRKEFPRPDSEAFQKLRHYFDAGVDYPLDAKTGRFKECPALLTVKKDWFSPAKQEGGWIRVYPFDARTTKSPYKSSLTDIRQAVRSVEQYLKTAEQVFSLNSNESDEFYRRKMKAACRRDTEVWTPPLMTSTSTSYSTTTTNNNNDSRGQTTFSAPVIITESNSDLSVTLD